MKQKIKISELKQLIKEEISNAKQLNENQQTANEILQLAKSLDFSKKADRDKFKNNVAKALETHVEVKKEQSKNLSNRKLSPLQLGYREFFTNLLSEFGVKSPAELSDAKKKEFFDTIRSKWPYQRRKINKENK